MTSKNAKEAFLTRGYNNWKAATDAFRKHESSDYRSCSLYTCTCTFKYFCIKGSCDHNMFFLSGSCDNSMFVPIEHVTTSFFFANGSHDHSM